MMTEAPPYSKELEQAVLGAILVDPERLINGSTTIFKPSLFYNDAHRRIADAIVALLERDILPDSPNVIVKMTETGKLQKAGGAYAITGLPEFASIDLKGDLTRLHDLAEKRLLRELVLHLASQDFEHHTISEIRDQVEKLLHSSVESVKSHIGVIEEPMSAHEMASDQTPQPPEIISGILPRETVLMVYGETATGKTLLCLNMGMSLAMGEPWHNLQISDSHSVLYILAEGGYFSLRERIKKLVTASKLPPEGRFFLWPVRPFNILESAHYSEISRVIAKYSPDVIIFDPLRKLHQEDENDNGKMEAVMSRLRSFVTGQGRSLIVVHHTNKAIQSARGASAIVGDCDTVLKLEWNRSDKTIGTRTLRAEKVRHAEAPPDLVLHLLKDTLQFTAANPVGCDRIVNILLNGGGKIGSRNKLVQALIAMGAMKKSRAYDLIKEAIAANQIRLEKDSSISLIIPDSTPPHDSNHPSGKS